MFKLLVIWIFYILYVGVRLLTETKGARKNPTVLVKDQYPGRKCKI